MDEARRGRGGSGDANAMSFGEHLEDLRRRLILAVAGLVPILVVSVVIGTDVLELLVAPLQASLRSKGLPPTLQATGVLETFGTYVRVVMVLTLLAGSPWVALQAWRFVAPGLYASEQRFARLLAPLSLVLTVGSAAFLYYVMLPVVLAFFIGFGSGIGKPRTVSAPLPAGVSVAREAVLPADPASPGVGDAWVNTTLMQWRVVVGVREGGPVIRGVPLTAGSGIAQQYRIREYVGTVLGLALGFALGFQMPVVVLLLGWVGIVEPRDLVRYRKHAVMACLVAGAILTPADPLSMVLMAGPLYLLYELGVLLLRVLPAERVARGFGGGEGADAGEE